MTTDQTDPWLKKSVWDVSAAVALLLGLRPDEPDGYGFIYIDVPPYRPIASIVGDDRVEVCLECGTKHKYAVECPKCGYVYPHRIDWHQRMKEIRVIAFEDIRAGILHHLGDDDDPLVAPRDFCQWAIWRGYAVPASWRIAFLDDPAPMAQLATEPEPKEQGQVATTMTANPSRVTKSKRMVAWMAEMWERRVDIAGIYPQPTALQTMDWLKKHGSEDVFPRGQKNRNSLQWITAFGEVKSVSKKRVDNVLSEWRTAGLLPTEKKIPA
ncbi:MAG: hypothetical protein IPN92_10055 [Chromatiaceae bacterium]|nr:hypothetical protein [Chromatiaceae bacterium]